MAHFSPSGWDLWESPKKLNHSILEWIENNKKTGEQPSNCWIVHPEYSNLFDMLVEPEEIFHVKDGSSFEYEYSQKNEMIEEICSNAFQKFEFDLLNGMLLNHKDCIVQLAGLRKLSISSEFPEICPYAYSYVFFKTSLSKKTYFYSDTFNQKYSFPVLIRKELVFYANHFVKYQLNLSGSVNQDLLIWALDKIVYRFCINFYQAWLTIAEVRSKEISVPNWNEIEKLKTDCFPNFAFKFIVDKRNKLNAVESYSYMIKTKDVPYECNFEKMVEGKELWESYTPQRIALRIMEDPSDANVKLKKSVEHYVRKLSF